MGCRCQTIPSAVSFASLRLKSITQCHQFIHLGDDAICSARGGRGKGSSRNIPVDTRFCPAVPVILRNTRFDEMRDISGKINTCRRNDITGRTTCSSVVPAPMPPLNPERSVGLCRSRNKGYLCQGHVTFGKMREAALDLSPWSDLMCRSALRIRAEIMRIGTKDAWTPSSAMLRGLINADFAPTDSNANSRELRTELILLLDGEMSVPLL